MSAELIDINQEFDQGNQFTLDVCEALATLLDNSFRVIVKYQGQNLPEYDDDKKNVVICTSRECHSVPYSHWGFAKDCLEAGGGTIEDGVYQYNYCYYERTGWNACIPSPEKCPEPKGGREYGRYE